MPIETMRHLLGRDILGSSLFKIVSPKPQRRKRAHEEQSHQAALFKWLSLWNESVRAVTFHIPNGGTRNAIEAKILKGQGVTPGVPDIYMAIPNLHYHGLFIEMKSKEGKITELQKKMHERLVANRYCVLVCYDWFEAKEGIIEYLKTKRGNCNDQCAAA